MKKKTLSIAITLVTLAFTGCSSAISVEPIESKETVEETSQVEETIEESTETVSENEPEPAVPEATHAGGFTISGDRLTVTGGAYEQDGNPDNGAETIDWIVLEETEDSLLLISRDVLDMVPFNSSFEGTTWDDSYIRTYLNDTFYNTAFNDSEKSVILDYPTTPGDVSENIPEVTDKVFLLSEEEVLKYLPTEEDRMATVSQYAKAQGVWSIDAENYELFGFKADEVSDKMIGCGNWWLRTNGKRTTFAMDVGASGIIRTAGHDVGMTADGIRPVISISIHE